MPSPDPEPPAPPEPGVESSGLDPDAAKLFGLGDGQEQWKEHVRQSGDAALPMGTLGAYELLDRIGGGGQGSVYRARQPGTGRIVAIKRLWADAATDAAGTDRLQREIDALTRLSHRNVVTIHAVEVIEGRRVLVMEYVDGPTIARWSQEAWAVGREPLRRVLEAFIQVCEGVSHGHQRGVVHCDLKPDNVLVDPQDTPRILDFGIARILAADRAGRSGWTMVGFAGTPAYAAPEQATASPGGVDTRSDVYALGVMLYRLVAGVDPFEGGPGLAGIAAIARAQARGVPSVRDHRPGVSREIDWIIARATAIEPADRYQSVDALSADIRRLLACEPVAARRPDAVYVCTRFIKRHPMGVALGAVALLAVLAASTLAATQAYRLGVANRNLGEALARAETATQEAKDQQARAEREAASQRETSEMLYRAIAGATLYPGAFEPRVDTPMRKTYAAILNNAAGRMTPETELALRFNYAITLRAARQYDQALAELARAAAISRRHDAPDSLRRWQIFEQTSHCLFGAGRAADVEQLCRDTLVETRESQLVHQDMGLRYKLAVALARAGRPREDFVAAATDAFERAGRGQQSWHRLYRIYEMTAQAAFERGWFDLAEQWAGRAVEDAIAEQAGPMTKARLRTLAASSLLSLARPGDAEPLAREASDTLLKSEGPGGADAHPALVAHADSLHQLGRFAEAADRWELAARRPLTAPDGERAAAPILLRYAAASLGASDLDTGRNLLRRAIAAISDEAREDAVLAVEAALGRSGWRVSSGLADEFPDLRALFVLDR